MTGGMGVVLATSVPTFKRLTLYSRNDEIRREENQSELDRRSSLVTYLPQALSSSI